MRSDLVVEVRFVSLECEAAVLSGNDDGHWLVCDHSLPLVEDTRAKGFLPLLLLAGSFVTAQTAATVIYVLLDSSVQ